MKTRPIEWRFVAVLLFLREILDLKDVLPRFWDAGRFAFKDDDAESNKAQKFSDDDISLADKGIKSVLWWRYGSMLLLLGNMYILRMQAELQSCPCHPLKSDMLQGARGSLTDPYYAYRRQFFQETGVSEPCPARGCNAALLACGWIKKRLRELRRDVTAQVLVTVQGSTDRDQQIILSDWYLAIGFCEYTLLLKSTPWEVLPLKAIAIAAFDVEVAIEHTKDALQQYENGPSNHESSKFTLATLHPATVLGQQCRLWVSRQRTREELPSLSALVAVLRGIRLTERSIEAVHKMHKHVALAHSGPAYRSLGIRFKCFERMVAKRPDLLKAWESACKEVAN